jgi:hypothetical protein
MKTNQSKSKIGGAILVFSLLFGIGIALSTTAQAQNRDDRYAQDRDRNDIDQNRRGRNWDRYGNYGGSFDLRQTALNAGYNEGIKEARKDREKGRRTDYRNQSTYQKATKDYSSRLGDRELYRRYFREAYENGYNEESYVQGRNNRDDRYSNRNRNDNANQNRRGRNWDGYGNFGGSFQLRQTALNAGYNEGIKQGHNDRNKRNDNSYQNQSAYQKATKDYNSRLGDREVYRRYFREAYQTGYSDGINGY